MRCEVCGAPISNEKTQCVRCASGRISAIPIVAPADRPDSISVKDRWGSMSDASGPGPVPPNSTAVKPEQSSSIVLEEKYRLLDEIGRGAMGTVFLAEDLSLKRKVAVKFLLPDLAGIPECAERFHHEAVSMAAICDNNVAQIYAFGNHSGTPYFVMEYLDGETVEDVIDTHNRRGFFIPLADTIEILVQAVSGLAAIHRAGAIHRDIKPANILLSSNMVRAVIMDFGLVRNVKIEDETRALAGTPAYMAPELIEGHHGADRSPLTDIYSMGTTAYEIITGSLPFGGETWVEILRKHITEVPAFPSERRSGLPEQLDALIFRAMSKDPRERYQDCTELLDDLIAIEQLELSHEDSAIFPPNSPTPAQRRSSRSIRSNPSGSMRSTPTSGRGRLLVADSDSDFRALVHGAAKSAVPGSRICSATDGAMALKLFNEFDPHVVIIDLSLPEINGLEVAATLRGETGGANLIIIVVAQDGGHREAKILEQLKVNHFLTKPIDAETLSDMLRPMLERSLSLSRGSGSFPTL
jgi:eukaryotic-like serine/threonine-protein kinase